MIDDPELRMLFQAESEERLRSLEEGLKNIQDDPNDMELLEEIFRDAHTIKGSARMLNVRSIEQLSHYLEDGLDVARIAKVPLTGPIINMLYDGIDAIRQFVDEEVSGIKPRVDLKTELAKLETLRTEMEKEVKRFKEEGPEHAASVGGVGSSAAIQAFEAPVPSLKDSTAIKKEEEAITVNAQSPTTSSKSQETTAQTETTSVKNEALKTAPHTQEHKEEPKAQKKESAVRPGLSTIRIDTQQINELLTQAADLTVAKNRIFGLFEDIEEMLEYWEKKSRSLNQIVADAQTADKNNGIKDRSEVATELTEVLKKIVDSLAKLRANSYGDIHKLETIASSFVDRIRKLTLVPLSKLYDLFPRMVQDVARACNKEIEFVMEGGEITVDKKIIEDMKDPLMHLLRNAISHGIEPTEVRESLGKPAKGVVMLKAQQTSNNILIEIKDDGRGISIEGIKAKAIEKEIFTPAELEEMSESEIQAIIFQPGFSTAQQISNISGRGVGLDVVQNQIKKMNGVLQIDSTPGKGCSFIIQLAITLINTHVMIFQVDKRSYAIPIELIESCNLISSDRISSIEGYDIVFLQDQPISLVSLRKLLGLETQETREAFLSGDATQAATSMFSCIVLNFTGKRLAIIVDTILDEQKVVVSPPGPLLKGLRWLLGQTILKTGEVCMILNPFDLMTFAGAGSSTMGLKKKKSNIQKRKKLLLVEDSYTVRLMVSRELEEEGFEVLQAMNGIEGLEILKKNKVDAIISDVEMPGMDGLVMVSTIRRNRELYALPIVMMSTKASPEERQKGIEAGANIYLSKAEYNQADLTKMLRELLV